MNPLLDIMSPKARKITYGVLSLVGLVFFAWQAADGDWKTAATSLLGSAITALAHANTNPEDPQP